MSSLSAFVRPSFDSPISSCHIEFEGRFSESSKVLGDNPSSKRAVGEKDFFFSKFISEELFWNLNIELQGNWIKINTNFFSNKEKIPSIIQLISNKLFAQETQQDIRKGSEETAGKIKLLLGFLEHKFFGQIPDQISPTQDFIIEMSAQICVLLKRSRQFFQQQIDPKTQKNYHYWGNHFSSYYVAFGADLNEQDANGATYLMSFTLCSRRNLLAKHDKSVQCLKIPPLDPTIRCNMGFDLFDLSLLGIHRQKHAPNNFCCQYFSSNKVEYEDLLNRLIRGGAFPKDLRFSDYKTFISNLKSHLDGTDESDDNDDTTVSLEDTIKNYSNNNNRYIALVANLMNKKCFPSHLMTPFENLLVFARIFTGTHPNLKEHIQSAIVKYKKDLQSSISNAFGSYPSTNKPPLGIDRSNNQTGTSNEERYSDLSLTIAGFITGDPTQETALPATQP